MIEQEVKDEIDRIKRTLHGEPGIYMGALQRLENLEKRIDLGLNEIDGEVKTVRSLAEEASEDRQERRTKEESRKSGSCRWLRLR